MKAALCLLRDGPNYRRFEFLQGLKRAGYQIAEQINVVTPEDILVIWNRTGSAADEAKRFESAGAKVVVVENGFLGKVWQGKKCFSIALGHCNGAGVWPDKGPERWDRWGVDLKPFRSVGREVVVFAQRGIGEPGVASPVAWAESVSSLIRNSRVRQHPGKDAPAVSLEDDLVNARCAVTWNSAAGMQALTLGVPVYYGFPDWIGAKAAKPVSALLNGEPPSLDETARLEMFRRAAWALWSVEEVESGEAFSALLS